MKSPTVMIMAGGTGGHVFPGLAVASELRAAQSRVVWMGTRKGLEARLVPEAGIDMEWISISGVRGSGIVSWLLAPVRILRAVGQALKILRRVKPTAVLGMGGFVSGPGGVAAWLSRRPLLIHEQNSVPGTTNRLLARLASQVFEAFPGSFPATRHAECIGNPIRRELRSIGDPEERFPNRWKAQARRRILILGGSQGARKLNEVLPEALALVASDIRPEVWHQCGKDIATVESAYERLAIDARVSGFIDDMGSAYRWADLAVCRAGALTLGELAAVGMGAILVPYPFAIDDHQKKNAQYFQAHGAGLMLEEAEVTPQGLAEILAGMIADDDRLLKMAAAARSLDHEDATHRLATACIEAGR